MNNEKTGADDHHEKVDSAHTHSDQPGSELRLDSSISKGIGSAKKKMSGKSWGIVGGVVVLLIVIGLGVWASLGGGETRYGLLPGSDERSIFGELPFGGDKKNENISGLSGIECEHPNRRAIGVMLAGDPINRPLSGFAQADMVWELPVLVSNVTRLMALYQCNEPTEIGSVRSARHDYLFLADGVDAILSHWGGSYHALNRIDVGEFQTLNAIANPSGAFYRKEEIPRPYNGFTSYEGLWTALQEKGYRTESNFEGYDFKDDALAEERPAGGSLSIDWPGSFRVRWEYNPETNRYERYWADVLQQDPVTGETVAPSAVVVIRATNGAAEGPGGYNDVGIQGSGTGTLFQDGQTQNIKWAKSKVKFNDPMKFTDAETGEPVVFTRGQVWIMTPSDDIPVSWEPVEEGADTTATQ